MMQQSEGFFQREDRRLVDKLKPNFSFRFSQPFMG
jgi:hypothetical protein